MSAFVMDPSLEIRKLLPSQIRELSSILETHELWKRLMGMIPKYLGKTDYKCDVTGQNHHKYNSEHFRLIENESEKSKRTCTEILLDEWGTSGRIRPALGHLLYLLTKANLFRAADYIAIDLLHQDKPKRPEVGPEAEIPINLSDIIKQTDNEIERILDDVGYVGSAVNLIRRYSDKTPKKINKIPEIVITPDIEPDLSAAFQVPLVIPKSKEQEEVSDMINFSRTQVESEVRELESEELPVVINQSAESRVTETDSQEIPVVVNEPSDSFETDLPNISLIRGLNTDDAIPYVANFPNLPCLGLDTPVLPSLRVNIAISNGCQSSSISNTTTSYTSESYQSSDGTTTDSYSPAFSQILGSTGQLPPTARQNDGSTSNLQSNEIDQFGNSLPRFDLLGEPWPENEATPLPNTLQILDVGSQSIQISSSPASSESRSCSSPLPNLSLDTVLPHYNYGNLQMATNNFNEQKYKGQNFEGRLLGSGEFGSVYLAIDLIDKPVAVKKLFIGDVEIVNVDDEVTKQFRNEVEVLSNYKHENLLTILGYSCDGCTYCLLYEYIPGGPLQDRLQNAPDQLTWKQRLNIAMGTSKAISYLHTAFSTPLIHRDIKSANILLNSENQPKLSDFGLIKLIPNQSITTGTTAFGTSAYMPREAFGRDVSVKLDTFSFGVVLLELLTSLPPIDNNREGIDLVTHLGETIVNDDISRVVDYKAGSWQENGVDYAQKFYKIALGCLEEKRNRPTMLEVKMALDDLIKDIDVV